MNPDHVHLADWDAAYLLGALSPMERRRYEEHLADCRTCRDALSELAPTLGLLARVPPERAGSLVEPVDDADAPPGPHARAKFLARVDDEVREARRRHVLGWGGVLAAAAAVVVAVVLAVATPQPAARTAQVVALEPVADVPLSATVALTGVAWGTRLEMVCDYPESDRDAPPEGWAYVLVVTADDGSTSELSTWRARPGSTTRLDAGTALDPDDIAAIEVRSLDGERVLLRGEPPAAE